MIYPYTSYALTLYLLLQIDFPAHSEDEWAQIRLLRDDVNLAMEAARVEKVCMPQHLCPRKPLRFHHSIIFPVDLRSPRFQQNSFYFQSMLFSMRFEQNDFFVFPVHF